ncbi:MAG: hypothetical protein OET90_05995 [Desulfuromonadales bacterium]|nr:hypothetical protein [Desulfuromonadales bacterium]
MAGDGGSEDGSDIFWPGYVDATTNLILNLLFLLTILMVAVFMFALELGRSSQIKMEMPPKTVGDPVKELVALPQPSALVEQNEELKLEVQRLNELLAQRDAAQQSAGGPIKKLDATSPIEKPKHGLDKALSSEFEVQVRFAADAVSFTPEEEQKLIESLRPIVAGGIANISVEVPTGFSEAKRLGFYRAMSVRNLLIEMELPTEQIKVSVVEGKSSANPSLVRVKSQ